MHKRHLVVILVVIALALVALLAYSLDRSAWAFTLFEGDETLGWWAALTIEAGIVGLIIGRAVAPVLPLPEVDVQQIVTWAGRGLASALCVQAIISLTAGYLRGGESMLALLGGSWAAYAVTIVAWLTINGVIPALTYWLSEILALSVRAWLSGVSLAHHDAPAAHHGAPLVSIQQVVAPQLSHEERLELAVEDRESRLARTVELIMEHGYTVKRAVRETGAPESTVRRRLAQLELQEARQ